MANQQKIQIESYFSQFGQDRFIAEYLFKYKHNGIFVDIGAHDGISFSNSYFFEHALNWNGIAIEPIPRIYKKLCANRKCITINGCVSDMAGRAAFLDVQGTVEDVDGVVGSGDMYSGLVDKFDEGHMARIDDELKCRGGQTRQIEVDCYLLDDLLSRYDYSHVDYMSLDTEGGELGILQSIDLDHVSISVMSIENNYHLSEFRDYLAPYGFHFVARAGCDDIFQKK